MKRTFCFAASYFTTCLCLIWTFDASALGQRPEMVAQTGHTFVVSSVAFSPDGKTLASGSADQMIKLWDVASGTELRSLSGHTGVVWSVAFSPDGKTLASASKDQTVKLWDVVSGRELLTLKGHTDDVWSVAFSHNGKMLASGCLDKTIKLWDVAKGSELRTLKGHTDAVWSVAFSANDEILASGGGKDHAVKLWDLPSGTELRTLSGHADDIYSVKFSADGKLLASGSADSTIRIWNVSNGTEVHVLKGATNGIYSVAFSPDGRLLAGGGNDGQIRLWDVVSGSELPALKTHPGLISSVAFNPDGRTLVSGSWDNTIKLWDVPGRTEQRLLAEHSGWVLSIAFSPNGKMLAGGTWDKKVKLWDLAGGTELRLLSGHSEAVRSVAFSPDGKTLASGSGDQTVKLWDVQSGIELRTLKGHSDGVESVAFSPDGLTLASSGRDKLIKLWDVATGKELLTLKGHSDWIESVQFGRGGKTLASGSRDHTIKLWNVVDGKELRTLKGHSDGVESVAFSPDGLTLASAGSDQVIKLWDVTTGTETRNLKGHSDWIYSLAFSPNGKMLASCGRDNTIKLWDAATGTELRTLRANSGWIFSVAFSSDGKTVVSGSLDTYLRFWNTADGAELAGLVAIDRNDWLVVTPDGLFDGTPVAWNKTIWRFDNNTFNHVPIESFFGDFLYPGLLEDILAGKRPKAPSDISKKDRRQPQLKLALANGNRDTRLATRQVALKIDISRSPAGARDVRLFRNGSLVKVWRGDVFKGGRRVILAATVPIVAGENTLTAYAFNRDNIKSSDASLVVNGADNLKRAGTLYVLALGANKYRNKDYDLNFAVADVNEISKQIKAYQDKLSDYARTEIILLTDQDATKASIMRALRRFSAGPGMSAEPGLSPVLKQQLEKIKPIEPEDGLVIYYAGHGRAIGQHFYLMPHDFVARNEELFMGSSISDIELNQALERVDAGKLVMIIDACQSGQVLGSEREGRGPMNSKGLAQLAYDKGMYILTAAQSFQAAKEVSRSRAGEKIGHGLLTFALLEGFTRARRDAEGRVTEREWMKYAVDQVPAMEIEEMTKRSSEAKQTNRPAPRGELVFVNGDDSGAVQRPRVFYRRELEGHPLIVARQ